MQQVDPATVDTVLQQAPIIRAGLQKIEQALVERLRNEADAKATDIRTMCTNGERDAAPSEAAHAAKVRLFVLTAANITGEGTAEILVKALPKIIEITRNNPAPFVANVLAGATSASAISSAHRY